jgi:hypothetical protein
VVTSSILRCADTVFSGVIIGVVFAYVCS